MATKLFLCMTVVHTHHLRGRNATRVSFKGLARTVTKYRVNFRIYKLLSLLHFYIYDIPSIHPCLSAQINLRVNNSGSSNSKICRDSVIPSSRRLGCNSYIFPWKRRLQRQWIERWLAIRGVYSDTTQLNSTDPVEQRTAKSVVFLFMTSQPTNWVNWVTTFIDRWQLFTLWTCRQLDVELSWVELCRYKHLFSHRQ